MSMRLLALPAHVAPSQQCVTSRRTARWRHCPKLAVAAATPLRATSPASLAADVVAGLSVATLTVPQARLSGLTSWHRRLVTDWTTFQSLAYAALAGAPPIQGLHSNAVSAFPASVLASSRYLQIGAVALTSLLTAASLDAIGLQSGTALYVGGATILAYVVGATRCILGALNLGEVAMRIHPAVLDGFMLAVVWTVAASQVPVILGVSPGSGMSYLHAAVSCLAQPQKWQLGQLAVAALTALCLTKGRRIHPLFPGALAACALGCLLSSLKLAVGPTVGSISATMPSLLTPSSLPWHLLPALAAPGVAIAVAGFAESAGISSRFAAEDGETWNCSRELLAHGASNLLVAAIGGFPVSGSLSRSSLGRAAGATSQRAHLVTGLAVLLILPFGAALLTSLPRATLGGLVVCAMAPLMTPPVAMRLSPGAELTRGVLLGWATCLASLACSPRLELGLLSGVLVSAVLRVLGLGREA